MSVQTIKSIDGIRFSVWSPTEIRKYSVAEITAPETYNEEGTPVHGGLMDGHLGVLEPGQTCLTCGNTTARCPGHFGHIELAEPVMHIAFIDNIHKLLQSTCRSCSRLKVPQETLDDFLRIRNKEAAYAIVSRKRIPEQIIEKARKAKDCPHCGKKQYDLIFTKPTTFVEKADGEEYRLQPINIRNRFSQIIDDDLKLLGYDPDTARPEWFILQALPVPPVTVRPSIILETGIRSEDDLTHKMVDIIRVNQRLKESPGVGHAPPDTAGLGGLAPVPFHNLFRQRGVRHTPGPPPVRTPTQDAHPAAQGQGGPVPRIPLRQEGGLFQPHGDIPPTQTWISRRWAYPSRWP